MNKETKPGSDIPTYIFKILKEKGNVVIGRKYVVKYGEEKLKEILSKNGFHVNLSVITQDKSNSIHPKDATYILEERR